MEGKLKSNKVVHNCTICKEEYELELKAVGEMTYSEQIKYAVEYYYCPKCRKENDK